MMSRTAWSHRQVLRIGLVLGALTFSMIQTPQEEMLRAALTVWSQPACPSTCSRSHGSRRRSYRPFRKGVCSCAVRDRRQTGSSRSRMVACRDG